MSLEEAAQEVWRILSQNDVDETVRYLATVTRSIEANHLDLSAVTGHSYRDLLSACDGVVALQRDCADILTIEQALNEVDPPEPSGPNGFPVANTDARRPTALMEDVKLLLPQSWFASRQRRRLQCAAPEVLSVALSGDRQPEGRGSEMEDSTATQEKTDESHKISSGACKGAKNRATATAPVKVPASDFLSIESLPLPITEHLGTTEPQKHDVVLDAERRAWLDEELQALHFEYMTTAAATSAQQGFQAMESELDSLIVDQDGCSKFLPRHDRFPPPMEGGGIGKTDSKNARGNAAAVAPQEAAKDLFSPSAHQLPLLRLARRLRDAQAVLRSCAVIGGKDLLAKNAKGCSPLTAGEAPSWLVSMWRRMATLEVRLVKLVIMRLRRIADAYARLIEQQRRILQQRPSSTLKDSGASKVPGGSKVADDGTDRDEPTQNDASAWRAEEGRHRFLMWATLAQGEAFFQILRNSPTLLSAMAACAPHPVQQKCFCPIWLPHPAPEPNTCKNGCDDVASPLETVSIRSKRTSLDTHEALLFEMASRNVRDVMAEVLGTDPPLVGRGEADLKDDETAQGRAGAAKPLRLLLALVAVLLLRESQLSAERWLMMTPESMDSSGFVKRVRGAKRDESNGPVSSAVTGITSADKNTGSCGGNGEKTASASKSSRVFATPTHLAALGLSLMSSRCHLRSITAKEAALDTSNTAWALRSFTGLSFLLRTFSDYIDLVQVSLNESSLRSKNGALTDVELPVLQLLRCAWMTEGADGEERPVDCCADFPLSELRHRDRLKRDETVEYSVARMDDAAETLDELLQWRVRSTGGDSRMDPAGNCSQTPSATPISPRALSVASVATPKRSRRERESRVADPGAMEANEKTASLLVVARHRAYVERLRMSLNKVEELQHGSSVPGTACSIFTDGSSRQELSDFRSSTVDTVSEVMSPLKYVFKQLLLPLVSSLVVLLSREPATLTVQGARNCDMTPPSLDGTALAPLRAVLGGGRASPPAVSHSLTSGHATQPDSVTIGGTWATVNAEHWWDRAARATLQAALECCVTVALNCSEFINACVMHGLVASARHLLLSREENPQAEELKNRDGASGHGGARKAASAAALRQKTWSVLLSVLHSHSLSADVGMTTSDVGQLSSSPWYPSEARGLSERCGVSSMATGINWDRFGRAPSALVSSNDHSDFSSGGDAVFREESLDVSWIACQHEALRPFLARFVPGEKHDRDSSDVFLDAAQQHQLILVLGHLRNHLFPQWQGAEGGTCSNAEAIQQDEAFLFNGHAAELLLLCLLKLVESVEERGSTEAPTPALREHGSDQPHESKPSLRAQVIAWIRGAFNEVAARLRQTDEAGKSSLPPNAEIAAVVYSYELSLLLRVYKEALQRLALAAPVHERANIELLCEEINNVYGKAQAPWQDVLVQFYERSLRETYEVALFLDRNDCSLAPPRPLHVGGSPTWVRGPPLSSHESAASTTATTGVAATANVPAHASPISRLTYPAQPTPAIALLVADTIRFLHEGLYGVSQVYGEPGINTIGNVGSAFAWTTRRHYTFSGRPRMLVTRKMREQVLHRLAVATAEVFVRELFPLIDSMTSSPNCGKSGDAISPSTTAVLRSRVDEMRLQWCMDIFFISAVFDVGNSMQTITAADVSGASRVSRPGVFFAENEEGGGYNSEVSAAAMDAAVACVEGGPFRAVMHHLAQTCDPLRWRDAVPLVLNAFRHFLCASGLLWVMQKGPCEVEDGIGACDETSSSVLHMAGAALNTPSYISSSSDEVARSKHSAPLSSEQLLRPRSTVDRLALLPIVVSSTGMNVVGAETPGMSSTVSFTGNTGIRSRATGPSQPFVPPAASALNPFPSSSSPSAAGYRLPGSSLAAVGDATTSFSPAAYPLAGGDSAFTFPNPGVARVTTGGTSSAGTTAAAAAAASSLWGTTQRGWNQLWGSR